MVFFLEGSRIWLSFAVKMLIVNVSAFTSDSLNRKPYSCSFCQPSCSRVYRETARSTNTKQRVQTQYHHFHVSLPNEEETFDDAVVGYNDENGFDVSVMGRRDMLFLLFGGANAFVAQSSLAAASLPATATTTASSTAHIPFMEESYSLQGTITQNMIDSLLFERVLGTGSYKIVYLVSTATSATSSPSFANASFLNEKNEISQSTLPSLSLPPNTKRRYALAVERLTTKRSVKDGIRGISMAQFIQEQLTDVADQKRFEQIEEWWIQSTNVAHYDHGNIGQKRVFPSSTALVERSQTIPRRFLGTKYLMALKPLYAIDFKSLVQKTPTLYPIVHDVDKAGNIAVRKFPPPKTIAGLALTEQSALNLAYEICYSGNLMHSLGIVHRDIKPKNIMLTFEGKPVIIDFGFAQVGKPIKTTSKTITNNNKNSKSRNTQDRICVVNQGQNKGEVRYVLAQDVVQYRGCQEGDVYAMGKTLYEILFGEATPEQQSSGKLTITSEDAQLYNDQFRSILMEDNYQAQSRVSRFYPMSIKVYEILMSVIRGMCRFDNPDSFAEASETLSFAMKNPFQ